MNDPESPRRISDLATAFGVDANTIRQWCKRYADYLSPEAKPPSGGTRLFSSRDYGILHYVHSALKSGMNHAEITLKMGEISFKEGESDIIVGVTEVIQGDSPSIQPDSPPDSQPITLVLNEIVLLRRELSEAQARQSTGKDQFLSGVVVGIFCVIVVAALWAWLGY